MFGNVDDLDKPGLLLSVPAAALSYIGSLFSTYLIPMMNYTADWWKAPLVYVGVMRSADMHLADGGAFRLTRENYTEFIAAVESRAKLGELRSYRIDSRSGIVSFRAPNGRMIRCDASSVQSVASAFYTRHYSIIDVRGRAVIDVGAFVGDSALYYIIEGRAREVYSLEPVQSLCDVAKRNASLNRMGKRVHVLRAALASKDTAQGSIRDGFNIGSERARTISLATLVRAYKIKSGALKVDCEGCEYNIFRNVSSDTLRHFDVINVEYHHGYKDIVERLKREGFDVKRTRPALNFTNMLGVHTVRGDIIAERPHSWKTQGRFGK